jgi:hypothetical protein
VSKGLDLALPQQGQHRLDVDLGWGQEVFTWNG